MTDNQAAAVSGPQTPYIPRPMRWFHRDRQAFDAITIETVPRWKESELSGDEWRFSARVCFWSKGNVVAVKTASDVESACKFLAYWSATIWEDAVDGKNRHELVNPNFNRADYCDQEGCNEKHTVTYRLKAQYSREGFKGDTSTPLYVCFCERHKHRGDCGLEDSDSNYELIER